MTLTCTHCGKRLSRKTARQIEGVVMCSTCMFKPRRDSETRPQGGDDLSAPFTGSGGGASQSPRVLRMLSPTGDTLETRNITNLNPLEIADIEAELRLKVGEEADVRFVQEDGEG